MLKKYLYFICIAILCVSTAFGQTADVPASRLYPKIKVDATSLVVVDLAHDKIDGQVAACGLQGIINRGSKQKVYVLNTYCHDNHGGWNNPPDKNRQAEMGSVWLKQVFASMPKQELKTDTTQYDPGFMALLKKYIGVVKGIIIYDDSLRDATTEAATTIAGQTDGLILSPELAEKVKAYHLPIVADLRGKFKNDIDCLRWLKDNYFAGAYHQIAFTWSHMDGSANSWGGANKDYVVANRLFTFYLDIENKAEAKHYEDIIKLYRRELL